MLQSIRDHTQGWIAGVIISLLILSFALWGIHSYVGSSGTSDVVAKINGEALSKRQLSLAYERLRRHVQAQNNTAQLSLQTETALKERALQALIETEALKQSALESGFRISTIQMDSFIEALPEFQVNGRFSPEKFRIALESNLFTPGDFVELVRTSLLIDQPRLGIMFTSFALPNEVKQVMGLINQERDFQYLLIPLDAIKKEQISLSDAQINAYYTEHQDLFKTPEQVAIEYVELDFNKILDTIKPSEEELKKYYNETSSSYTSSKSDKLTAVLPYEQVKDQVRKAYLSQKAEEKYGDLREKLSSISYEHPESLSEVAKQLSLTIQSSELFTANQNGKDPGGKDITKNPKIRDAAFSEDVLTRQNNSDVIQLDSEHAVVLRAKTHTPARVLSLENVKPQIIEKLSQVERDTKAKEMANAILQKIAKGETSENIASTYHLTWKKSGYMKRNSSALDAAILETVFVMPKPHSSKPSYSIAKTPSGYAVIALQGVKEAPLNAKETPEKVYTEQVKNAQGLIEYELYKNSIILNSKIKMVSE